MNIFYLHNDPVKAAEYHCDAHIIKMIVEYAQLLSTAHHVLDGDDVFSDRIYKPTHKNHPCAKWVRESHLNYTWLYRLFCACCDQFMIRRGKRHKTDMIMRDLLSTVPKNIKRRRFSHPPQCMPEEYRCDNAVDAYRLFYVLDKARFCTWSNGVPDWFDIMTVSHSINWSQHWVDKADGKGQKLIATIQ